MESGLKGIIRVLVVEDSPLMCKVLTNILNPDPHILVAGIANNGKEAVEIVPRLKPDIITMDIHMPIMDGYEATKRIMAFNPTPILIISSSVLKVGMEKVFKAIRGGLAGSTVLDAKMPLILEGNFKPGFRIELHIKDLMNAMETAHDLDTPLLLTNQALEIMKALKVDGKQGDDHGGLIQFYENLANVKVRKT